MRDVVEIVKEKLLRKKEVAALLACSERTVDRLVAVGRLAATVAQLPSFGFTSEQNPHSQIDSQNLGAGSLSVSAAVAKNKTRKTDKTPVNIGESQSQSQPVAMSHGEAEWRRGGDSNPRYGFTRTTV